MDKFKTLKDIRYTSNRITQKDMSKLLGVSVSAYNKKENNVTPFLPHEMIKISNFLKMSKNDFLKSFFKDLIFYDKKVECDSRN